MIIAYITILFAVIGLLMYAFCANAKLAEIGRLVFACAFLIVMLNAAHNVFRLGA